MLDSQTTVPPYLNGRLAPLDDDRRRARLRGFINNECYEIDWWGLIRLRDGTLFPTSGHSWQPSHDMASFLALICNKLNDEVHYNGMWAVIVFHGESRFAFIWKDWDGDIQIFAEEEEVRAMHATSVETICKNCDKAIQEWMTRLFDQVEIAPNQTVQLAGGEKATTDIAPPILMQDDQAAAGPNGRSRHPSDDRDGTAAGSRA